MPDMKCKWEDLEISLVYPDFLITRRIARGLHGYTHEYVSRLSITQQLDVLTRCIDALTSFTGQKPLGFTAPAWSTSPDLIPMLEDFGILYDHSFMHHDVQP